METNQAYKDKLEKAKKRVKAIKGFFSHVQIFLIVSIILAVLYVLQVEPIIRIREAVNEEVMSWINLNIWINLGIWALIIVIHGLVVFKFRLSFLKDWEERQIQKYMNEE
ncbi:MAG: 2TM domain-containing protein [Eudoraea sp.]|nr:2TM domain-containing protein [Eudoraea sp.]NNJ39822.1 2TM domain-containing protein [Eudoraea sp.]